MKKTARLIIPVWGDVYSHKLVSITLPAVLAPGNLPALCEMFEVELVIVTEARLFGPIRNSQSFQLAEKLCIARLIPLDDLLTDVPGDYGAVLTYALFRGFSDLGGRMTETYLLFLNADFIISDGSLCHLGNLMRQGKRVIHAPSFRVVFEDVWRPLQARIDASSCTLGVPSREMVKLALAHKHPTVCARTVNQRLCHLLWMDQYYWYVDDDTMISYQSPVALVSIKPERVVTEPFMFWDYGFIPEAAPTAESHFIVDSDDFFMMELQRRDTGREMIRVGWISFDDIARSESIRSTKEHRECGRQLLKIHASDLPEDLDKVIEESRAYMAEVYRRLSPTPVTYIGHPLLGPWFDEATQRMHGRQGQRVPHSKGEADFGLAPAGPSSRAQGRANTALRLLETIYRKTFGSPPQVGKFHPLWVDAAPIVGRIAAWRDAGEQRILWVSSSDSLLRRILGGRVEPAALLAAKIRGSILERAPYDACVCELTLNELSDLDRLYAKIRPLIKGSGHIVVNVVKKNIVFEGAELVLENTVFPSVDISEIHFFGTATTGLLRMLYMRASSSFQTHPIARALVVSALLFLLAPIVGLANARATRRDSTIFAPTWTSLMIEFTVKRARPSEAEPTSQC
jgi:hypothetical protein